MIDAITRRDFLRASAIYSAIGVAPQFLTGTAEASSVISGFGDSRVLVVVQLAGGNDGLNTLVPHDDDAYYKARPNLALGKDKLIALDTGISLNRALTGLMRLHDSGTLATVQGVGYPNPDRSHFRSMEIWQTATDSNRYSSDGWIGRYFDHHCSGTGQPHAGVAVTAERPQAFEGKRGLGVAFTDPGNFKWRESAGGATEQAFERLNRGRSGNDTLDYLRHVTSNALTSTREVRAAVERAGLKPGGGKLERSLRVVSAMIKGELDTRIYYVTLSGFDTHSNQAGQHERLLGQVGDALHAFQERLRRDGTAPRVLTMVFSEFGRRVAENRSGGTDHGTANPLFLIGDCVVPGVHGVAPDLGDLDRGDLRHTVDFRSVYASVLEDWFQADSEAVLGRAFPTIPVIGRS